MAEADNQPGVTQAAEDRAEVELRTRPAFEWCSHLEACVAQLSMQRLEVRQQIEAQQAERRARNPHREETLSVRTAHQMARATVLGTEWERAASSLKQAGQQVRFTRRKLERLQSSRRLVRGQTNGLVYWVVKAPRFKLQERTLKRSLRRSNGQRHMALRTLRVLRPALLQPEVRSRIHGVTESYLVNDERLKLSLGDLSQASESLNGRISGALRLASQLRVLGAKPVTMEVNVRPDTTDTNYVNCLVEVKRLG